LLSSAQALSASLTSLSFDKVEVNSSKDLTFTVTNRGSNTLSVNVTSPASPFSLASADSFTLEAGATQTLTVRFSPTNGGRAYIANQGGNSVSVFDTTTFPPSKLGTVSVGQEPRSLAVSQDGSKVYVATFGDNSIWIIDTTTNQAEPLVQSNFFAPWLGPWDIKLTPDGSTVVVINRGSNNVGLINVNTSQPEATVSVGSNPQGNAFDPELPQAIVANSGSNNVTFVNTDNATASSLPVGETPV